MKHNLLYVICFFLLNIALPDITCLAETSGKLNAARRENVSLHKKINFVFSKNRKTPNPAGWDEYDGSIYNPERGYGWLTDLSGKGRDRGADAAIILRNGMKSTLQELDRLELANWQGAADNVPQIFRIDLPDGWYSVTCTSVDPGVGPLPLVDMRSFKCRAHNAVFAGPDYGPPLTAGGEELVEGAGIVEATDGHLRIVAGDPAYGGWTWSHPGPWYKGWGRWLGHDYMYANNWHQKFTRAVDPGFHSLRMNSIEIERVDMPVRNTSLIFRDFFNRDNSQDVNTGVAEADHWTKFNLNRGEKESLNVELYQTSIRVSDNDSGEGIIGLLQNKPGPDSGVIRYSTRVSLFTGAGSNKLSGFQEAGIIILADSNEPTDFNTTFIGVGYDGRRSGSTGFLIYRSGDGKEGYRISLEVPDTSLPFNITEGEYGIVVDHDISQNILTAIIINGIDVTNYWGVKERTQMIKHGMYGIRSVIGKSNPNVNLQQFYWYYQVNYLRT